MNRRRGAGALWRQANMSLWLWPTVAVVVAYALGLWISANPLGQGAITSHLFEGGVSGGRSILTALVGGLVTALSVIFSLTITGLQLVHQQYSPRLLRNFMRDRATKVTLGIFAGTVAYMLAVLQSLPPSDSAEPLPRLGIFIGMVLFMACVGTVAYFAQHITQSIRVYRTMDRVVADSLKAIALSHGTRDRQPLTTLRAALPDPPDGAQAIPAWRSGYVLEIDIAALAAEARRQGAALRLRPVIGDHITEGTPLALCWATEGGTPDTARFRRTLRRHVEIGADRSEDTDISYGFRQLVDVAVRAMSPSLNDPYTAVQAVDHITVLLCWLARDGVPDGFARDDDGTLRVAAPGLDLGDFVRLAVEQPARYGAGEPAVAVRLLKLIKDVGSLADPELHPMLRTEIDRVCRYAAAAGTHEEELAPVHAEADAARATLHGHVSAQPASPIRM